MENLATNAVVLRLLYFDIKVVIRDLWSGANIRFLNRFCSFKPVTLHSLQKHGFIDLLIHPTRPTLNCSALLEISFDSRRM